MRSTSGGETRCSYLRSLGHSTQTPLACSLELAAGIEDAKLYICEHSGHSPFVEETERFGNEISSFLELKS